MFIEQRVRIKKLQPKTIYQYSIDVNSPGHVRGEIYTKILDSLLRRCRLALWEGERELWGIVFGVKGVFSTFGLV